MLLALHLLGREVLALRLHHDQAEDAVEHGPPFGFSGSGSAQAELAGDWMPDQVGARLHARPRTGGTGRDVRLG